MRRLRKHRAGMSATAGLSCQYDSGVFFGNRITTTVRAEKPTVHI